MGAYKLPVGYCVMERAIELRDTEEFYNKHGSYMDPVTKTILGEEVKILRFMYNLCGGDARFDELRRSEMAKITDPRQ